MFADYIQIRENADSRQSLIDAPAAEAAYTVMYAQLLQRGQQRSQGEILLVPTFHPVSEFKTAMVLDRFKVQFKRDLIAAPATCTESITRKQSCAPPCCKNVVKYIYFCCGAAGVIHHLYRQG